MAQRVLSRGAPIGRSRAYVAIGDVPVEGPLGRSLVFLVREADESQMTDAQLGRRVREITERAQLADAAIREVARRRGIGGREVRPQVYEQRQRSRKIGQQSQSQTQQRRKSPERKRQQKRQVSRAKPT